MALQELSTNVINTMVKQSTARLTWLRVSLAVCAVLSGVTTMRGQHAFEYAARVGANVLHYETDYGKPMPNYNVGMDFSYKYRSPFYIGARVGLGIDVAASTFVGNEPAPAGNGYADKYIVPSWYDPDGSSDIVEFGYNLGRITETQQLIIASAPVQLGFFAGDFSMFAGVRVSVPVHGCYWQRIQNADVSLYYPSTGVTIGRGNSGGNIPDELIQSLAAGNVARTVNGINALRDDSYDRFKPHFAIMVDLNYSFPIGDKTDCAVGAYLEYDPVAYKTPMTDNTSLMQWHYARNEHDGNKPVWRRDYSSVLEANRANGGEMLSPGTMGESPIVSKFKRASVGIRISISLWSVPLDFGNMYRKQHRNNICHCDFDN